MPDGSQDEAVGPLLSEMRMKLNDSEGFELENQLIGYLRNTFVAYVSALTALSSERIPFVVLHGPLVRAIGGFSHLEFDYRTVRDLLNINIDNAGEFGLPDRSDKEALSGDNSTENNLPLAPSDVIQGDKNIQKFNKFCIHTCGRKCDRSDQERGSFPRRAVPGQRINDQKMKDRTFPGFCLYFWLLRSLFDLQRLGQFKVVSAVENISSATEYTRLLLPSLVNIPQVRQKISTSLSATLKAVSITYPSQAHQKRDLYKAVRDTIERLSFTDSNIFSFALSEGQFTTPLEIYRYRPKREFSELLGYELGINNEFEPMLRAIFPSSPTNSHPGYRVLMSYVRTSPLREPVRFEYFDMPHITDPKQILGPAYLLSVPYQEYGIPIILYYADKLARTPTQLVRTIIEREYLDLVLENRFDNPVEIWQILGRLSRGYFQREGFQ
jgi:hypothetical protein